jgi:transcription termination factor Rho
MLNPAAEVMLLLVDQSYEMLSEFHRAFGDLNFLYTTYEDDVDRQVFVADYILKRAKRYAESGKDVVLFVDSLTALAHAFNDTEASMGGKTLPCGLEVKTIHYLKKYFGAARSLEKGGSITIIGALVVDTGDPMDDVLARELFEIATLELVLNSQLATKRIYPAIDFEKSRGKYNTKIKTSEEEECEFLFKNNVLPKLGDIGVIELLSETKTKENFMQTVKTLSKEN